MAGPIEKITDALMLKKQPFAGTSAGTRKALIDSGAMHPDDFKAEPAPPEPPAPIGGDPTRRVTQQEYDATLAQQKAKQDVDYQAYQQRKHKR